MTASSTGPERRWRLFAARDVAIFAAAWLILACLLISADAFEALYEYSRAHEDWELDEAVLAILAGIFAAGIFISIAAKRQYDAFRREAAGKQDVETKLRENEARLRALIDNAPSSISLKGPDGRYLLVNKHFKDLVGEPPEAVLGKRAVDFLDPESIRQNVESDRIVLTEGRVLTQEDRFAVKGVERDFLATKFPVLNDEGQVTAVGTIRLDMSHQKKIERELRAANFQAEEASAAKDLFLANVSHELRTPLTAIIGYSQLMANEVIKGKPGDETDDTYVDYAGRIHASGQHLLALINDILDVSRIMAGARDHIDVAEIDLVEAIEASLAMVRPRADDKRQTIMVAVPEALPYLEGDERLIRQIVINFLSNAVKFTPDSGRITVFAGTADDGGLSFGVRDTGVGIAPEDIPKVLEPFGQVATDLKDRHEGTGLGLTLAKKLVESHGGELSIDSTPGSGTVVTATFPPERTVRRAAS